MSYLDVPRVHFGGQFFVDPSTINNDPTHYKPEVTNPSPWQTPNGNHHFKFQDCVIRSVVGTNGPTSDPIVGVSLVTTDKPSAAKIVDLDVYQQGVPTIYGIQLKLTMPDGTFILGTVDPIVLNQLWWVSVLPTRNWGDGYPGDSYGGDMNACGAFQSVIRFKQKDWTITTSTILNDLKSQTVVEDDELLLSIKFVLDGYQNVPQNAGFLTGRIVGTLGPVKPNEPRQNPGQRWLNGRPLPSNAEWFVPSFNNAPFKVDRERSKLIIDLANGICRQTAAGPPVDLGTVTASVVTNPRDKLFVQIGEVDYSSFSYDNNAQIVELDLNSTTLELLAKGPLRLTMSKSNLGQQEIFSENIKELNYCVETRPIRVKGNIGSQASTKVYVNRLGIPLPGKQLAVHVESVFGTTPGATVPPTNPGNTPQGDGALQASITATDSNGFAMVNLEVLKDPGSRTPQLDGQLYYVQVFDPDLPPPDWKTASPIQRHLVSVVAFSQYTVNENPPWEEIQRLMTPYNKLYPSMRERIDLTDEHSFTVFSLNPPWLPVFHDPRTGPLGINAGAIPYYLSKDFNDPMYMPITRDLSPDKITTIMHYIKNLQDNNQDSDNQKNT